MKIKILFLGLLMLVPCLFGFQPDRFYISQPVAVVELFTSEGCSSCPAADELLKEMTELTRAEGKEVMALAFHVTYWNRLGWEDPYSQELFTSRQKTYAQVLGLPQLYTPQAIVNGKKEFVGSNPVAFREAIDAAMNDNAVCPLAAAAKIENQKLTIDYQVDNVPKNTVLNIAWVENYAERHIPRGENKNKILKHYNTVKKFEIRELQLQESITINIDESGDPQETSVVLYVQHKRNMKILGAAQIAL